MTNTQAEDLRRVMQRLFRGFGALASDATPCGKPLSMAHAHALMVLLGQGQLTQQALGAELCIDKSNVARLCAKLVDAGHIEQRPNASDGRSRLVSLTPRGAHLAREVDAASRAKFAALLSNLPAGQRNDVIRGLQHLVAAIEPVAARGAA